MSHEWPGYRSRTYYARSHRGNCRSRSHCACRWNQTAWSTPGRTTQVESTWVWPRVRHSRSLPTTRKRRPKNRRRINWRRQSHRQSVHDWFSQCALYDGKGPIKYLSVWSKHRGSDGHRLLDQVSQRLKERPTEWVSQSVVNHVRFTVRIFAQAPTIYLAIRHFMKHSCQGVLIEHLVVSF